MKKVLLTILVLLTFGTVSVVLADDLNPPSWRGNLNTSWVQYEFLDDTEPPVFDDGSLPFGDPFDVGVTPALGGGWIANKLPYDPPGDSGDGWWNLGEFAITLPNSQIPNPIKWIWIQLTWSPQLEGNVPFVETEFPPNGFTDPTDVPESEELLFTDPATGLQVFHSTYKIELPINPDEETIFIFGGIDLDEIIIDTLCLPEPAMMGMLGLGGLTMLRRRNKK